MLPSSLVCRFFFFFAVTANIKKIQTIGQYVKAGFIGHVRFHILQGSQIRIDHLLAPDTDVMRKR